MAVYVRHKPKITRAPAPKTYDEADLRAERIDGGIYYLKLALTKLQHAPNTAARVRLAISSAKGAKRHADGQLTRLQMKGKG